MFVTLLVYNSNKMHKSQSLFNLTTALHISGVTITHLQEYKTTVTTASGNLNVCYPLHRILPLFSILSRINPVQAIQSYFLRSILILSKRSVYFRFTQKEIVSISLLPHISSSLI